MRTRLMLAAAFASAGAAFVPAQNAAAFCDLKFFEATGYCNVCLLVADHSQRPQPIFCPL